MAKKNNNDVPLGKDLLDSFFDASNAADERKLRQAAAEMNGESAGQYGSDSASPARTATGAAAEAGAKPSSGQKYFVFDPEAIPGKETKEPFVLVPAEVYRHVPWWGWVTIAVGLAMVVAGIILLPRVRLNRVAARLGDRDRVAAQQAMGDLVIHGDVMTVRKLYDVAASKQEGMPARLRAVDAMSLIENESEVDRALLRLELSGTLEEEVKSAAAAARKQREAYKTGRNR